MWISAVWSVCPLSRGGWCSLAHLYFRAACYLAPCGPVLPCSWMWRSTLPSHSPLFSLTTDGSKHGNKGSVECTYTAAFCLFRILWMRQFYPRTYFTLCAVGHQLYRHCHQFVSVIKQKQWTRGICNLSYLVCLKKMHIFNKQKMRIFLMF